MATKRSISNLKARILEPALTSHYEVKITPPAGIGDILNRTDQELLTVFCSEASLPGSSFNTFEINNDYNGVTERHAYRRMYDERIDLTFYVDGRNYLPIKFFELWMDYIDGSIEPALLPTIPEVTDNLTPDEITSSNPKYQSDYTYRVRYPKDYQSDTIQILKFEKDYIKKIRYDFIGCYPIAINSMPISYDGSDLLKCTVGISYKRYIVNNVYNPSSGGKLSESPSVAPDAGDANDGGGILPFI